MSTVVADPKALRASLKKITEKLPKAIADPRSNCLASQKKVFLDSPRLNFLFGGGYSYTRIHQFYGPEHSGKTTICCYIGGQLQKKMPLIIPGKKVVVYIDFERTFDPTYAKSLGLSVEEDDFVLIQADVGEDAYMIAEELIKSGCVAACILDSDSAMPTRAEMEDVVGKANFGGSAKLIASSIKRLNILCANYDTSFLHISQERDDIGAYSPNGAKPKKSTGGVAIKFFASTRQRVTKIETINRGSEAVGIQMKVRNIKNKTGGVPWREAVLDLYFKDGFDSTSEYIAMINELIDDLPDIEKKGAYFRSAKYGFDCKGKDAFEAWLLANPKVFAQLKDLVNTTMAAHTSVDTMVAPEDALEEEESEKEYTDELADTTGIVVPTVEVPAEALAVVQKAKASKGESDEPKPLDLES